MQQEYFTTLTLSLRLLNSTFYEERAKSASCQRQIDLMNGKEDVNEALGQACEENRRLKLQLEDAKLQLRQLNEQLGGSNEEGGSIDRLLQSIASRLDIIAVKKSKHRK